MFIAKVANEKLILTLTLILSSSTIFSGTPTLAVPSASSKPGTSSSVKSATTAAKAASSAAKSGAPSPTSSPSSSPPTSPAAKPASAAAASAVNLTGTWSIKFRETPNPKTHIMAVKVSQKGSALSATGVDEYGDVILTGTFAAPNKINLKRTYKGNQVNPQAQFDGFYSPPTALTPASAKGKWSAQPFADKSQKPKASSNSGDWDANIFTGPPINK